MERTRSRSIAIEFAWLVGLLAVALTSSGQCQESRDALELEFRTKIQPWLAQHCESCHQGVEAEAKLEVTHFYDPENVSRNWALWQAIESRVHENEMPPPDVATQPTQSERGLLSNWTTRFRRSEAERFRGDPGPTSVRRLSNAEFDQSIHALTHVDIRPARNFPVDPANEAGFDNSAESLTISPALLSKYIDGCRLVADHMILAPTGIQFASHPVVTDTDRDKYCVNRIVSFYARQPTSLEAYLLACWELRARGVDANAPASVQEFARSAQLSPKYLKTIWDLLHNQSYQFGPIVKMQESWNAMPTDLGSNGEVKAMCRSLAEELLATRSKLRPALSGFGGPNVNAGSQTMILWKNRVMAAQRRTSRAQANNAESSDSGLSEADRERYKASDESVRQQILNDYATFCSLVPDAFYVAERGRANIDAKDADREGKGRLLSAGFHSMTGYFRDDSPLVELILDESESEELDRLWSDFEFIAQPIYRQYSSFIWYERAESGFINEEAFNSIRSEDRSSTSTAMIQRFKELYRTKVKRRDVSDALVQAVDDYFDDVDRQFRRLEARLTASESVQLESLISFANRAYRRPLSDSEANGIRSFYRSLREGSHSDHRSAIDDTLIAILVSPSHLFRWDLKCDTSRVVQLKDWELASRLSFFLWGCGPDAKTMELARTGELSNPQKLLEETHRLLADARARNMIKAFVGDWLDCRRFDSFNSVDREQFSSFNDALRQSMADEPIEYTLDLLQRNGSILDLVDSNHVVVDQRLARHYGMPFPERGDEAWARVENAARFERGGLIPMGVFLTQNAPGLRTSPVKRGYWVVRRLLGEKIPPPPAKVPELPASEQQLGDLTLRQVLAQHREHASCAACHRRFDSVGLLLESFDPIGRPRTQDLGGRVIASDAVLPNGKDAEGIGGLKAYILEERVEDFRRHFCKSLLAFALGRSLVVADDLLIDEMISRLDRDGNRIQSVFEVIVQSTAFRSKRPAVMGEWGVDTRDGSE